MADYRRLLTTACHECVIDVTAWRGPSDAPGSGDVTVGLISGHDAVHFSSWRGRFQRALLALRGESYPALFFNGRDEVEAFSAAVAEAAEVAFGDRD
jgi:hypothetical protein